MFYYASAFNQDISSWTGTAATTAQTVMFSGRDCVSSEIHVRHAPVRRVRAIQSKSTWIAPSPPPSPPPPPPLSPIPSASWHAFVEACLSESGAEGTGECTEWASGNNYGTMPNWDTSLVTDMNGSDGTVLRGFGGKSTFNGDITEWDTSQVTDMRYMFQSASAFNHDISSWTGSAATSAQTDMFLRAQLRFKRNLSAPTPSPVRRIRAQVPRQFRIQAGMTFVKDCLAESAAIGETGECIDWARSQNVWYGTMPNWDTSLVEDMSGWTGMCSQGFGGKSTFDGDISKWDTAQVTDMYSMFRSLLRSTKTLGVGTQRK